jgi:hypothetical protein
MISLWCDSPKPTNQLPQKTDAKPIIPKTNAHENQSSSFAGQTPADNSDICVYLRPSAVKNFFPPWLNKTEPINLTTNYTD